MSSDFEGLPECDRTHCWDRCVPHRPAAPCFPLDSLLANQEQEEDALIESNSAIGTSHVPLSVPYRTFPLFFREVVGPAEGFQSLPECVRK